jgi:heme-degrading monooxygenase HmoA
MIRSVLSFSILPGRRDEFVAAFRRLAVLEKASHQEGFLRSQLHLPLVGGADEAMVTADWESAAGYEGWLANPVRAEIGEVLGPLLAEESDARLYEIIEDVDRGAR